MPATINPGPRPTVRKAQGWSDYDLLTRRPQDERVAIGSAAVITLLFHGALLLAIPWHAGAAAHRPPQPPKVEYTLEPLTPEEQREMMKYIQTNPNAPETPPPETPNISSRNQRAAQPDPNPKENADVPRTQGEVEDSPTFLTGNPNSPPPSPPPSPPSAQSQARAPASPPAQETPAEKPPEQPTPPAQPVASAPPPLPALQGLPGTGEGINLADKPVESTTATPPEKPADKPADNSDTTATETQPTPVAQTPPAQPAQDAPQNPPAQPAANSPPAPMRQRVQVELPPGALVKTVANAGNMGPETANAKFREFGGYLETMFEAVGSAWRVSCQKTTLGTNDRDGARVVVVYSINAKGEVTDLEVVDSTASQTATLLCVNAIKSRAPFGPWTKEMIAQLNPAEQIRITFWYR